ncbi:hypothetical protein ACFL0C_02000 [Patescibacteria group bacterium]
MKEFRVLILVFFSIVTARMLSETSSCPLNMPDICGKGYLILIPFILSSYFIDSLLAKLSIEKDDKKGSIISIIFSVPYIIFSLFVIKTFFSTLSAVTVEYILSINLLTALITYLLIYFMNNLKVIRRLNVVFMITLFASAAIFILL